jgi:hypothetical protein
VTVESVLCTQSHSEEIESAAAGRTGGFSAALLIASYLKLKNKERSTPLETSLG